MYKQRCLKGGVRYNMDVWIVFHHNQSICRSPLKATNSSDVLDSICGSLIDHKKVLERWNLFLRWGQSWDVILLNVQMDRPCVFVIIRYCNRDRTLLFSQMNAIIADRAYNKSVQFSLPLVFFFSPRVVNLVNCVCIYLKLIIYRVKWLVWAILLIGSWQHACGFLQNHIQ